MIVVKLTRLERASLIDITKDSIVECEKQLKLLKKAGAMKYWVEFRKEQLLNARMALAKLKKI